MPAMLSISMPVVYSTMSLLSWWNIEIGMGDAIFSICFETDTSFLIPFPHGLERLREIYQDLLTGALSVVTDLFLMANRYDELVEQEYSL